MAYRETFSTWNVYPVAERAETAHSELGEEKRRHQHGEAQLTITTLKRVFPGLSSSQGG